MPKSAKNRDEDLPGTLQRSPAKARRTYREAHDSAVETYGEGERAHRTAFAALKHPFEKVGDRWQRKEGARKGPSDAQAARRGARARRGGRTAGGVDANATKAHLMDLARRLDVPGRSRMTKDQLVAALQKANRRRTERARQRS